MNEQSKKSETKAIKPKETDLGRVLRGTVFAFSLSETRGKGSARNVVFRFRYSFAVKYTTSMYITHIQSSITRSLHFVAAMDALHRGIAEVVYPTIAAYN
jgi:hypothetical protein